MTMPRTSSLVSVAALALALAGCQTVGNPFGGFGGSSGKPTPLAPVPTKPVTATELPPPTPTPEQQAAEELRGTDTPEQQVASLPPASDIKLEREDLIGGWKVSSAGANCQLFLTLTGWTGGYRATTRGCPAGDLTKIQAWDLNGQQVVLKGDGGGEVARLYPTGQERFSGQTVAASAVSVYR
ncbi:MAG: protease inhibitor Inh/omp19 family protein [Hyphomicrobiales bacterium]